MIIAAGLLVLLPMTAASCDDEPTGIRVGTAAVGAVDEIVEAPGTVTARAAATLTAPAAGTLAELRVEPGDRVDKGDLLAVIDSPELERRRESAARALDQTGDVSVDSGTSEFVAVRKRTDRQATEAFEQAADAADKLADPELKKALKHQIAAAEEQYEAASDAAAAAVRSVQRGVSSLGRAVGALSAAQRLQAEQAYELADAAVEALSLRAPVAGVIQAGGPAQPAAAPDLSALIQSNTANTAATGVDTEISEGGYVSAGTPVLTIVDTSTLGLTADVDETDVLLVEPGIEADVELDAAPGVGYTATVRSTDLLPTTSARGGVSYQIRLDLAKADPAPRPGMSAVVRLKVRQADDAVTVPASAVLSVDGKDTVWTVQDGRFRSVPVTLGVQGEDSVQVVDGVGAGERIVVAGADQVIEGEETP
ncbi:RND family efflux transporter MFP subunit [Actinoplanes lutulentus]|uniref:RND family efflux transporter MFP subunit n=1 Tax=Actinoplanes lutulentus TaxID=1287878 RepID=A0A327Z2S7_9ACTN|nr:RND family efflux transporter MFP subunit [Actinoplanes lutulentus]